MHRGQQPFAFYPVGRHSRWQGLLVARPAWNVERMKHLSKATLVIMTLSAIWLGGVVVTASIKISHFRSDNEFLTQANYLGCTRSLRTDCETGRDRSEARYHQAIRDAWTNVLGWATLPPAVLLLLSWFIFDHKKTRR